MTHADSLLSTEVYSRQSRAASARRRPAADSLLSTEVYGSDLTVPPPNPDLAAQSHVGDYPALHHRSLNDPDSFWREAAAGIDWHAPFTQVLDDSAAPFYKWFVGNPITINQRDRDWHALMADPAMDGPCPTEAMDAVIGLPHPVKGNAIHAFVILRQGVEDTGDALISELKAHVGKTMGPIAKPEAIGVVPRLPKTRSGKIMRRVLRAQALGQPLGDLRTIEE